MIIFELFILFNTFWIQYFLRNMFKMSNQINTVWLRGLNLHIFKDGRLN